MCLLSLLRASSTESHNESRRKLGVPDSLFNCAAIMPGGVITKSSVKVSTKRCWSNISERWMSVRYLVPKCWNEILESSLYMARQQESVPMKKFGVYRASKAAKNFMQKFWVEEKRFSERKYLHFLFCSLQYNWIVTQRTEKVLRLVKEFLFAASICHTSHSIYCISFRKSQSNNAILSRFKIMRQMCF